MEFRLKTNRRQATVNRLPKNTLDSGAREAMSDAGTKACGQTVGEQHLHLRSPQGCTVVVDCVASDDMNASYVRRDARNAWSVCGKTRHDKSKCRYANCECRTCGNSDTSLQCAVTREERRRHQRKREEQCKQKVSREFE